MEENLEKMMYPGHCPPPPPPECGCDSVPVVIERIMKPFKNPDGSYSARYYYQYPITTFRAVHMTESVHSPTLGDVLDRLSHTIERKQTIIANGNRDSILTRTAQDGVLGELIKTDYVDPKRRSKNHVPSEHGLFRALQLQEDSYKSLVDKETVRATSVENILMEDLRSEVGRAKEEEEKLNAALYNMDRDFVRDDILGESGTVVTELTVDAENLANIKFTKTKGSLKTGSTNESCQQIDILTPIVEMIDQKVKDSSDAMNIIDPEIFDNTDESLVVKTEFKPGEGYTIGRLTVARKNVKNGSDTEKIYTFKADDLEKKINEVSANETEMILFPKYADTAEFLEEVRAIFA